MDLDRLSHADLADAAAALSTFERLAAKGVLKFESGASRNAGPRPDMAGKRTESLPRLQQEIIAVLRESGTLSYPEILAATGMRDGSLSANLTLLERKRIVTKTVGKRPAGAVGRPPRSGNTYSLSPDPSDPTADHTDSQG